MIYKVYSLIKGYWSLWASDSRLEHQADPNDAISQLGSGPFRAFFFSVSGSVSGLELRGGRFALFSVSRDVFWGVLPCKARNLNSLFRACGWQEAMGDLAVIVTYTDRSHE